MEKKNTRTELLILLLSFFIGSGLSYLIKIFSGVEKIIFVICIIIIIILVGMLIYQKYKEYKTTRFAVIIFLLNDKDELMIVHNKTHKILMAPCKTMKSNEMPHQAAKRILKEQVGLEPEDYKIDCRIHQLTGTYYRILDCDTPYAAQQEFVSKQSNNIRYHYSLIYIYKLEEGVTVTRCTEYFPQFLSLSQIKEIEDPIKPFQDIIQRYEILLNKLNEQKGEIV